MKILLLFLASTLAASAASVYIRDGASGSGADWSDALDDLPAILTRGNTYYIGDGTYAGYTFDDAISGSTIITVKKAVASDHGTETGWNSTYGDGQATFSGTLTFLTSSYVVDGITGGGPSAWKTGFGFYVDVTAAAYNNGIYCDTGVTNITARHMEIVGHGADADAGTQDLIICQAGNGPLTFSYMYLHESGRCIIFNRSHDTTFEYLWTGYFQNTEGQHAELASIWIDFSNSYVSNNVFRYCVFTHTEGTGGIISESYNMQVYGCVFAPQDGNTLTGGNGLIGTWSASTVLNLKVFNNTFINTTRVLGLVDAGDTGVEFQNNLVYNAAVGNDGFGLAYFYHINNYYNTISDGPVTEATQQTSSGDPFVAYSSADFRLNVNTTAGSNLGSPYDADMFGTTRASWTRGALEYSNARLSSSGGRISYGGRISR